MPSGEIFLEQIYHTEGNVEGKNRTGTTLVSPPKMMLPMDRIYLFVCSLSKESITLILFAALLF